MIFVINYKFRIFLGLFLINLHQIDICFTFVLSVTIKEINKD